MNGKNNFRKVTNKVTGVEELQFDCIVTSIGEAGKHENSNKTAFRLCQISFTDIKGVEQHNIGAMTYSDNIAVGEKATGSVRKVDGKIYITVFTSVQATDDMFGFDVAGNQGVELTPEQAKANRLAQSQLSQPV